ncbi:DUF2849 domain-containing protein [Ferrovibrio sp.]|uniref:DUF2849 domain-containing protein n=1 Tax=Ferrovibrio sp. TaxID=1917215 RepID=UPI001B5D418A|nr:DUF2849 domain-containing protein [Ferrovibrio sp.]MBP7066588.1 DUF2849 domain-containing protein [Ferrovibrio sp.]
MAKAPKLKHNPQIVTANHLARGDAVYLTRDFTWSRSIAQAVVAPDEGAAADLLAEANLQAARNIVVAPYLVPVLPGSQPPVPVQFRERIRASGPTTEAASLAEAAA